MKTKPYEAKDVFTPTKPARFTFVERQSVNDRLIPALKTPGKQIVVYGHSGSGKTTLLVNKLNKQYDYYIITRCISGLTFDQLLLDAFSQLGNFFESEKTVAGKSSISSSLKAEYLGIKAKIGAEESRDVSTTQQRLLPPQLTPQTLARLLGEAKCCWVLEDFHKIEPNEKRRLAQVMKVFMDMSDRFNDLKIIAIGAVGTARQVIEYDAEMRNRVSEIFVPLMTGEEIKLIPTIGEHLLNILIENDVKDDIAKYSNGLASVCHQLCLNMCFSAGIEKTSRQLRLFNRHILKKAIERYLEEASDTIKAAFDKAFRQTESTKFNDVQLIVEALLLVDQEGVVKPVLLDKIREKQKKYPLTNLNNTLDTLQSDEKGKIIRYDDVSGKYSFSDPFYRAFALASTVSVQEKPESARVSLYVSSPFEGALVNLIQDRFVTFSHLNFFDENQVPREDPKPLPKMNWNAPVFKGKRKNRGHRR